MRIGLNLLPLVPGVGGSWQYVEGMLAALAMHDHENEYVCFITAESRALVPAHPRFQVVQVALLASLRPLRIAYENTLFAAAAARYAVDCTHHMFGALPFFGRAPSVVTVFDMMAFERPQDFPSLKRAYLQHTRARAARHSAQLAPMSNATASALQSILGVASSSMTVVPPALLASFHPRAATDVEAFRARLGLPGQFWLFVAGSYPHKNAAPLLSAIATRHRSAADAWPLVIRGDPTAGLRAVADRMPPAAVRFLPRLTADEMALLYSAASALVFPSLYEGGGLPVIEALACGCPVVASDIPAVREYAGTTPLYFNARLHADMVTALTAAEGQSGALRRRLDGSARALDRFAPSTVARACMTAYERAVAKGAR